MWLTCARREGISLGMRVPPPSPGVAVVDLTVCDACGLCLPLCPPAAITLRRDGLHVDALTCTGCRKCVDPCPVGALRMTGVLLS
jgi:heterodisulfide reductase subunit A1